MKKRLGVFCCVILFCFSLCACGNTKAVDEELRGVWGVSTNMYSRVFMFTDGKYESMLNNSLGLQSETGTYKIKSNVIQVTLDDGDSYDLEYDYDSKTGSLTIYFNDRALERVN